MRRAAGAGRTTHPGPALTLVILACALGPTGVRAQRPDTLPVADTAAADTSRPRTPEQRALERLRALRPPTGGVRPPGDTLGPDTAVTPGRPAQPSSIVPDSVMRALLSLPGYEALAYAADSIRFDADTGRVHLLGPAELERMGQGMKADSLLVYDLEREVVCGYGQPTFTGREVEPVTSRQVCYDVRRRLGVALEGETTFTQGADWRVRGDELFQVGPSRTFVHDARFTSCDLEVPHYHFAAREVKLVRDSVMVARDITLNFADVPVFWLPFMVQSLKRGRRSGLLTPVFSANHVVRTSSGLRRRIDNVGLYWAINDYLGSELAFGWFADNYTSLRGVLEYRVLRQFLQGAVQYRQFWRDEGGRDLTLASRNSWRPDERTSVQVTANYASSADFVRRQTFDPRELTRALESTASIGRRFDWGSLDLSGTRQQHLNDGRVLTSAPTVGINLSPITLFGAPATQASWYNNASWNGSGRYSRVTTDIDETLASSGQDQTRTQASASSSFSLGALSWRQNASFQRDDRQRRGEPPLEGDSALFLPGSLAEELTWSTSLDYQLRLIGTSTLTPGLALNGRMVRSDTLTGMEFVDAPTRLDFRAGLKTDLFGFYPGVGPFDALRHRLTPSIDYTYSPEPQVTDRQREVFGSALESGLSERNRIAISLTQTFEAKYREPEGEAADTLEADTTASAEVPGGRQDEGPRRLPQARKLTLLSLRTSAIAYDWVQERETGQGLQTGQIDNSVTSDLLRGLQFSLTHDLFREFPLEEGQTVQDREFAPHLSAVRASFAVDSDSWLARLLRLGPRRSDPEEEPEPADAPAPEAAEQEEATDPIRRDIDMGGRDEGLGLVGGRRQVASPDPAGVGRWNAALSYSLVRPREEENTVGPQEQQMLQATINLQPTAFWSVNWRTGYNITEGAFQDHIVTLTRDLHRWQANFDFARVQNGNFTFQFRVSLRDNPDLKVDYEQRSDPLAGQRQTGF